MRGNPVPLQSQEWREKYPWLQSIIPADTLPEVRDGIVLEPTSNDQLHHEFNAALALLPGALAVYQASETGTVFCKQITTPTGFFTRDVPQFSHTHFVVLTDEAAITGDVPKQVLICEVTMDKYTGH